MPTIEEYWVKRAEQLEEKWHKEAKKLERRLQASYLRAYREVNKEMRLYLTKKGFDYSKLNEVLSKAEREIRKKGLTDYLDHLSEVDSTIKDSMEQEIKQHINLAKVTCLDAITSEMLRMLSDQAIQDEKAIRKQMTTVYTETLLRSKYEFLKLGIETPVYILNEKMIKDILSYPWSGENFSNRIWNNKKKLLQVLREELTQGVIQGLHADEVSERLAKKMNVEMKHAITLVHTESSYFYNQSTLDSFGEAELDQYKLHVTFDHRTSPKCRSLDTGKVYNRDDASVGYNYPPLHPRCRTLPIPYFEGVSGPKYRWVRDNTGKSVKVDEPEMTYNEYKKQFLK
ncbi:phage head morphogenesis, SPP1 gp7 family domain protein [Bacillus thuringiensis serovar morrisoni]|uniref:minor capsid protein n=1 Tax=Bacillus thuringiensis TaxID=1428 RepID=UPI0005AF3752|nr:phage head morphogenesis, SPP1 gp7 family domain protein [Bacillus thuringiensis serovar morrisoni]